MAPADVAKPVAGLSLDLDNLWSYLRSFGDERWRSYPSFLTAAVPRIIETLANLDLCATIFVVGRDALDSKHAALLDALIAAGYEIGNHLSSITLRSINSVSVRWTRILHAMSRLWARS